MKISKPSLRTFAFIGGLFLAAFFFGGAVSQGGLFGQTAAAWLQAIFSVVAIFAVWETAERQRLTDRQNAERQLQAAQQALEHEQAVVTAARMVERAMLIAACTSAAENLRSTLDWLLAQLGKQQKLSSIGAPTTAQLLKSAIGTFREAPTRELGDVALSNLHSRTIALTPVTQGFFELEAAALDGPEGPGVRTVYADHVKGMIRQVTQFEQRLEDIASPPE